MTYETALTPAEEKAFAEWKRRFAPNDSGEDYDFRGAFKAGLEPSPNGHWPDTFKKPNHPTFSDESKYAKYAPDKAGHWNGDEYVPAMTIEQQRAIALANARARMAEQQQAQAAPASPKKTFTGPLTTGQALTWGMNTPEAQDASKKILGGVADVGMEAGGAAGGQAVGAIPALSIPTFGLSIPVFGALGGFGGNIAGQIRRGEDVRFGPAVRAGLIGAVPGAPYISGAKGVIKEGAKLAATNLGASTVENTIETGKVTAPTLQQAGADIAGGFIGAGASKLMRPEVPTPLTPFEKLHADRIEAFRAVRPYGAKVAPFELEKGSDLMAKVAGGKVAVQKSMSTENQYVWQKMAREQLGLPVASKPVTVGRLLDNGKRFVGDYDKALVEAYKPYQAVKGVSAQAAKDVDDLRLARYAEQAQYNAFQNGKATYQDYQSAKAAADALDSAVEQHATSAGLKPEAIQEARKKIAIIYAYQNATDKTTGLIDARALGNMLNNDVPLTGNAAKIADFANSFDKNAVEATKAQAAGINNLTMQLSAGMMSQEGNSGKIVGLLNLFAGPTVRKRLMSEAYQNALAAASTRAGPENYAAALARFVPQSMGGEAQRDPYGFMKSFNQGVNRGASTP